MRRGRRPRETSALTDVDADCGRAEPQDRAGGNFGFEDANAFYESAIRASEVAHQHGAFLDAYFAMHSRGGAVDDAKLTAFCRADFSARCAEVHARAAALAFENDERHIEGFDARAGRYFCRHLVCEIIRRCAFHRDNHTTAH